MLVPLEFTDQFVILAEGRHDTHFFSSIIEERGLQKFQLVCEQDRRESEEDDDEGVAYGGGGRPGFLHFLNGAPLLKGFGNVRAFLIVSDNDDNPSESFKEVVNCIDSADPIDAYSNPPRKFIAPSDQLVKSGGDPQIVIMMVPGRDEKGALETLCLQAAARANRDAIKCVQEFFRCAKLEGWTKTKQDKMKLRSLIASSYKKNPDLTLASLWKKNPGLVPLKDAAFDPIAKILQSFDALLR